MPQECVIDTTILQKANAPLTHQPRQRSLFVRRLALLNDIARGTLTVLVSQQLLNEYQRQVPAPRNDTIKAFFALIDDPVRAIHNWAPWPGGRREHARHCRYPSEDDHVLRTAIRPDPSTIFTEEKRMLKSDRCIYQYFRVHIHGLPQTDSSLP